IEVAVADDLAVAAVELEYRVNDGAVQHEPLPLTGFGSPAAAGKHRFKLAGKAKPGDVVRVRLSAADNRTVPEAQLGPNVVHYPAGDRWCEMRIVTTAESLRRQDVAAKADEIERRLREIIEEVNRSQRAVYRLHQE